MTNRVAEPPVQGSEGTAPLPPAPRVDPGWSIRTAAMTAGAGLLLMSALAPFGLLVAVEGLVTRGDAARTAADIMASEGLFRAGVATLYLVIALDIVVAWALYRVFSPVSRSISLLAAAFRLVYAGVFLVAVSRLPGVVRLLGDDASLAALGPDQVHAQALLGIEDFTAVFDAGLLLFGLHLLVLGYLAYRSGYVPRLLGGLLAVAGLGYVVDSLTATLLPGSPTNVAAFTFAGEFLLALWLVIRAHRLPSIVAGRDDVTAVAR